MPVIADNFEIDDRYEYADKRGVGRAARSVRLTVVTAVCAMMTTALALVGAGTATAQSEADSLALKAMWSDYEGDFHASRDALNRLSEIDPARRQQVDHALWSIGVSSFTPPNPFPSFQGPQTAIVVLGFGLLPDGSLRPELVDRLRAARVQAITSPGSPIVVTGGNPQNGVTEAAAMRGWFVANGVAPERIHLEERAGSTVQNARYSAELMTSIGADSAVVVTSANHIRRGVADFNIAGVAVIGAMSTLDDLIPELWPLPRSEREGMYADATRVMGLA